MVISRHNTPQSVIRQLFRILARATKKKSVYVSLLMLLVGFFARPFVEGFSHKIGENLATRVIPPIEGPRQVENLAVSKLSAATYKVALVSHSRDVSSGELLRVAAALEKQVHEDLAPVWGVDAQVTAVPANGAAPSGQWWLELADELPKDLGGALSYHDVTSDGLPKAIISIQAAKQDGEAWSLLASHELIEMLLDPRANLLVNAPGRDRSRAYALEIADPTQRDSYQIDSVTVSNFVFPAWFDSQRPKGSTQFDRLRKIDAPLEIRPGGTLNFVSIPGGFEILSK